MGSVPNDDHDLLCSLNENSLICLYCSAETPFTTAFPTAPGDTTSMILMYLYAVLGLFQKALSMMEERSSPFRAFVIAPPPNGKNASRSQPSRLLLAHGFSKRASFPLPTWAPYREWGLRPPRRERYSGISIPGSYPSLWLILWRQVVLRP